MRRAKQIASSLRVNCVLESGTLPLGRARSSHAHTAYRLLELRAACQVPVPVS